MIVDKVLGDGVQLRLWFPETFLEIGSELVEICTNEQTGLVQCHKLQRDQYTPTLHSHLLKQITSLHKIATKYKKHIDYRENSYAPAIITKTGDQLDTIFEVDVETYRNFNQRRIRPSGNKIVQRYIYSRNMRAMVIRICYSRKGINQQREEYWGERFQNVQEIFRRNKKNFQIYQTYKTLAIVSVSINREDKVQHSKITNLKGLQKYLQPTKQIQKFLQQTQKIRITQLYLDYLIDLHNKPYLLNLKKISYTPQPQLLLRLGSSQSLHSIGSYGMCRLCSCSYLKMHLKQSISNKMLCQFLLHLRKRMKVWEYQGIGFVKDIIKNKAKSYVSLQVCEGCYRIVAEQYKLIESQKKLAKMCNIQTQQQIYNDNRRPPNIPQTLKQWRMMLYFVGISNIPHQLIGNEEDLILRYRLGNQEGVENCWRIGRNQEPNTGCFNGNFNLSLAIKKVKIHYFYSHSMNIDAFLKQTQINVQVGTYSNLKIFAKGSSSIISSFQCQFQPDLCLRQTSSILLFYNSGQYCQMTFKVGLICDGDYKVPQNISLKALNKTYFAGNSFANSNPIPREWMEALGVSHELQIPELSYEDIMRPCLQENFRDFLDVSKKDCFKKKSKLSRKSLHFYR